MQAAQFFDLLEAHGARVALNDGVRRIDYRELLCAVAVWRARLDELRAQRVAYRLANGLEWVALDLALLQSGRVAIPLPEFFSAAQCTHVLAASGADTLIVDSDETDAHFRHVGDHDRCRVHQRAGAAPPVHAGTAKITFTSGTTGAPKGVCLSASLMLATAESISSTLDTASPWRHLCALPLSLLLENVAGVYANLARGNEICVPALTELGMSGSSRTDVGRFVAAQCALAPQSAILVPQLLLAMVFAGELGVRLPDTYRFVAVGGAKVASSLLDRAQRLGIPVYEGYGLTECGSVVALNRPSSERYGTVGRPLPGVAIDVVDGELHVNGRALLGYLGDARADARIATGDLGAIDADGFVRVLGRRKHLFITAFGRNVSPEWIEGELQSEFAIAHAVAFGEALPRPVALLVPRAPADATAIQAAVDRANARLPDYAAIAAWRAIPLADFIAHGCLTENGRPRREAIVAAFGQAVEDLCRQLEEDFRATVRTA